MSVDPNLEQIVLVDTKGRPIGTAQKLDAHTATTPLHLAFSCYIFNDQGKLLVTRRADHKKVWPSVWTNSCCGHPLPQEPMAQALQRRVAYELGMEVAELTEVVPDYTYKTPPYNGVVEHEYCPIYFARAVGQPSPNGEEVAGYRWVSWQEYSSELKADDSNIWSWWAKDQHKHLGGRTELTQFTSTHR